MRPTQPPVQWSPGGLKLNVKLSLFTPWKGIVGVQRQRTSFWTSALSGGEWSISPPGRFNPGKETRHPLIKRLGCPQSGSRRFGDEKKISCPCQDPKPDRPARSPVVVHWLRYLGCLPQPVTRVKRPGREVVEVKDEWSHSSILWLKVRSSPPACYIVCCCGSTGHPALPYWRTDWLSSYLTSS